VSRTRTGKSTVGAGRRDAVTTRCGLSCADCSSAGRSPTCARDATTGSARGRSSRRSAKRSVPHNAAGVVHRDVKPQRCFRIRRGNNLDFTKLLDFGIAKQTDHDQGLTATGVIMGTAAYMAPEQARGEGVDARADIYAVGCMLFVMLAVRPPFTGCALILALKSESPPTERAWRSPSARPDRGRRSSRRHVPVVARALLARDLGIERLYVAGPAPLATVVASGIAQARAPRLAIEARSIAGRLASS